MYRKITIIAAVILALVLAVTPVGAITYGQPDGNGHPNVGLMVADLNGDGKLSLWCSGTLIAPTVFLTAGHCTNFFSRLEITNTWITFASEFDPGLDPQTAELHSISRFVTHPDFDLHTFFNDVGVVILAKPITDVTPGMLPTENLLDEMKASGTLKDQTFLNVGYGATVDFKGNPPILSRDGIRRFSTSPYGGLTQEWLHLLSNHDATGQGGGCLGDSGAPRFLGDRDLIVSITTWGDSYCRSLNMGPRLDTPAVRAFLGNYVTLP